MLSVLLAGDRSMVRRVMKMLLEADKNIHVLAEATNGIEVLNFMESHAIKKVYDGGNYLCAELTLKLLENFYSNPENTNLELSEYLQFSKRELEVLKLIGEGMTNNEMSEKLFLSRRTIEGHRQNLITKTGCRNTATLIKYAVLNKIII
jgi:DNA-binding NarL/FixJ family response regulator